MFATFWRELRAFVYRYAKFFHRDLRWSAGAAQVQAIQRLRDRFGELPDAGFNAAPAATIDEAIAKAAVACERTLKIHVHDEQILGALAMAEGKIAEMYTGEGKTVAAVLAVYSAAIAGARVHALTANDYLARRDAEWMGPAYRLLGLSVGYITAEMDSAARRLAYACDVTYAAPNEVGFDFLRDQLALKPGDLILPDFEAVLIDEADSILIDEARIPLVIAGGHIEAESLARRMAVIADQLFPGRDFIADQFQRNVRLTDAGAASVERMAGCGNLYESENMEQLAAIEAALHARILLRRDVDYIVRNGSIELVDEFKGRVAENRRWPAGLQTALEAKEGLDLRRQGRILGSITLQNLIRMYPRRCGMTGTAATEAQEFREFYGLDVVPIPPHRPVIRIDREDRVFPDAFAKQQALAAEIALLHAQGRPVLVGTASVAESERLSAALTVPHRVLNARQDAEEASIVAQAGERGAVTISTNMAGRGTDIVLGEGVAAIGGLHVIGTNRHESRRIDHQLRGRAGRQGDPGSSQFFLSLQDELLVRFGIAQWTPDAAGIATVQRVVEGQNFEIRQTLWKYEGLIEDYRKLVHGRRRELLMEDTDAAILGTIDVLWADFLAAVGELREGIHWRSWGGREPFHEFIADSTALFNELMTRLERISSGEEAPEPASFDATWTYLVNDRPFGTMGERIAAGVRGKLADLGLLGRR